MASFKNSACKTWKRWGIAQVEMKSLNKNTKLNERFRSSETVEKAILEENKFNFLYEDEQNYYFMNPKNFDQINIKKSIVGEKGKMLTENLEVKINFFEESPISLDLPNQITSFNQIFAFILIHRTYNIWTFSFFMISKVSFENR